MNVKEIDVINYKFDGVIEPYTLDNLYEFILELCNHNKLLDKRISTLFSMNSWLYKHTTKEDVRQEIIMRLMNGTLNKLPYIVGEERLKYLNTVISNVICLILKENFNIVDTLLDKNLVFNSIYNLEDTSKDETLNEIFDLFVGEHLERELLQLYYEGYNDKDMMEILSLGRHTFEKIRADIRQRLIENGYHYLEREGVK